MALFKISKGASGGLNSQALGDGYCWFTYDDGKFYIDYKDPTDDIVKRKALNADMADKDSLGNIIHSSYAASLDFTNNILQLLDKNNNAIGLPITIPLDNYKTKQTAITDPSASGSATAFIDTISQNANGVITVTKKNLPSTTLATDTGTSAITLTHGGKYKLTAAGSSVIFTMPSDNNTTYTFANGTNGFTVTPSGGTAQTVTVTPNVSKSDVGLSNVTNHQQVHEVAWDSTNKKITRSKNGTAGNVVSFAAGNGISLTAAASSLTITNNATGTLTGTPGAGKTITAFDQVNGAITATFSNISITKSQVSDFAHTHGNITNAGELETASLAVVTDANKKITTKDLTVSSATDSNDTSTRFVSSVTQNAQGQISVTTKPLPTYNNYSLPLAASGTRGGIQIGYTQSGQNYPVQLSSSEKAYVNVPWTDTTYIFDGTYNASTNKAATVSTVTNAVSQAFAANDAMVFKGLIGSNQTIRQLPTSGYNAGWTYRVADAGIFAGEYCEVGDLLIAINDGPASGNSVIGADWGKVEHNIDGAVFRGAGASNSSVGSSTQPVYVNASGVVTAITGAIANDTTGNAATATVASKLSNTSKIGDANKPVYFKADGTPEVINYTISESVPSGAVFTDTTYTFNTTAQTNKIQYKATGAPGWTDVPITISIANNITGSGTSGSLAKFNGTNAITTGPSFSNAISSQDQTTKFLREDGTWSAPTTVAAQIIRW